MNATRGVSRETRLPPPTAAAVFGASLATAIAFADMLATDGVSRGLLGPGEVDRLWERHLLNCVVLAPQIPPGSSVCDLGSGAGLPGLVLAIARPDLDVMALEPLKRRAVFLAEAVAGLGLDNVTVVRARAEESRGSIQVDVVTARAVAPLARLARWGLPLCRPGGMLLAMKGKSAASELGQAASTLTRLGAARWRILELGADVVQPPATVVQIVAGDRVHVAVDGGPR